MKNASLCTIISSPDPSLTLEQRLADPAFKFEAHHVKACSIVDIDKSNLAAFNCGIKDLNDFLVDDALRFQKACIADTTCVVYDKKLIGYFSLASDAISLSFTEKRMFKWPKRKVKSYPAVKIARMGFSVECRRRNLGSVCVKIIKGLAYSLNGEKSIACRFLTVDAYRPDAVPRGGVKRST